MKIVMMLCMLMSLAVGTMANAAANVPNLTSPITYYGEYTKSPKIVAMEAREFGDFWSALHKASFDGKVGMHVIEEIWYSKAERDKSIKARIALCNKDARCSLQTIWKSTLPSSEEGSSTYLAIFKYNIAGALYSIDYSYLTMDEEWNPSKAADPFGPLSK